MEQFPRLTFRTTRCMRLALSGRVGADGHVRRQRQDTLKGGGGDRLNGEDGKDLCIGGGGRDKAKKCERERTIA